MQTVIALNRVAANVHLDPTVRALLMEQLWTDLAGASSSISQALIGVLSDVRPELQAQVADGLVSAFKSERQWAEQIERASAGTLSGQEWQNLRAGICAWATSQDAPPIWQKLEAVLRLYASQQDRDGNDMNGGQDQDYCPLMWRADVGFLTPLPEETHEIVGWLRSSKDYQRERDQSGRYHHFGTVQLESGTAVRAAVVQPFKPGQLSMGRALEALNTCHNPRLSILLGIGGGVSKRKIGDVVVATGIINYDPMADTGSGIEREMDPYPIEPSMRGLLNEFFQEHGPEVPLRTEGKTTFYLTMGPIGSGSAVVKRAESDITKGLKAANRKTEIVETEAAALASAFFEDRDPSKQYLVVRGISDKADEEKNDDDHKLACENTVLGVRKLLEFVWPEIGKSS